MWLNEHRRGPGWKRFLSARRLCRFLLVLLPKQCGRGAAGAERLPPDRCLSWGLLRALVRSARRHGARGLRVSGTRAPGSHLPASRARISCRGSRAPGAAPSDCTTSARGGGGGAGPLKSTARPPDPPAPVPLWSRLDCGKGASWLRFWQRALDPHTPNSSVSVRSREDPFFLVRARWVFPPSLFNFFILPL